MLKKQLPILFLILWSQGSSCVLIETLFELVQYGWEFSKYLDNIEEHQKSGNSLKSILDGSADHQEIIGKLDNIDKKLGDLQAYAKENFDDIMESIRNLPDEIELRGTREDIIRFIAKTAEKWKLFEEYLRNGAKTGEQAYNQLASLIIYSIGEKVSDFRNALTPLAPIDKSTKGFFMLMAEHADDKRDTLCNNGETSHDIITRLFQIVIETEIKAYILQFFAHRLQLSENQGWRTQCRVLEQDLRRQFKTYTEVYRRALNSRSLPYIRSCDPQVWKRGTNFYELEGLRQQTAYRFNKCRKHNAVWTCERLGAGEALPQCALEPLNAHSACEDGKMTQCTNISPPHLKTEVCASTSGPHKIRFVKNPDNSTGPDTGSNCPSDDLKIFDNSGFWDSPQACSCQCNSKKWRILVTPQWSDVTHNYLVVGLRFAKEGNTLYIQIAQGRLEKNGRISDFSWVPKKPDGREVEINIDNAIFYLEDPQLPFGYALGGISIIRIDITSPGGFGIQLHGVGFDYESGQVQTYENNALTFKSIGQLRNERKAYPVGGFNSINMKPYSPARPIPREYYRVSLRQSDLSHDFGQSTVPLFDGVPIVTNPLSPIGGAGLFVKAQTDYAGFLSLRLFPMNYTYHMENFVEKRNFSFPSLWAN